MCHSKIELERYFTGDLSEAEAVRVREHADVCESCRAALAELEADKIRFLNVYPFEDLVKSVKAPKKLSFFGNIAETFRTPWRTQLYGGVAAAAMLLVMFVGLAWYIKNYDVIEDDGTLVAIGETGGGSDILYKGVSRQGGAEMEMSFRYMRGGEEGVGSLDKSYREGDKLQFIYSHNAKHYAALFSIDNNGLVSFYTGDDKSADITIPADSGNGLTFPASVMLDDTKGEELVVILISDAPVKAYKVKDWVARLSGGNYEDLSAIENSLRQNKLNDLVTLSSMRIKKE